MLMIQAEMEIMEFLPMLHGWIVEDEMESSLRASMVQVVLSKIPEQLDLIDQVVKS